MRISPLSSAAMAVVANNANTTPNAVRDTLIVPVPLLLFIVEAESRAL